MNLLPQSNFQLNSSVSVGPDGPSLTQLLNVVPCFVYRTDALDARHRPTTDLILYFDYVDDNKVDQIEMHVMLGAHFYLTLDGMERAVTFKELVVANRKFYALHVQIAVQPTKKQGLLKGLGSALIAFWPF